MFVVIHSRSNDSTYERKIAINSSLGCSNEKNDDDDDDVDDNDDVFGDDDIIDDKDDNFDNGDENGSTINSARPDERKRFRQPNHCNPNRKQSRIKFTSLSVNSTFDNFNSMTIFLQYDRFVKTLNVVIDCNDILVVKIPNNI